MTDFYLTEVVTRHQVMLERLKTGEWNRLREFVQELEIDVSARIAIFDELSEMSMFQLERNRAILRRIIDLPIERMREAWIAALREIAINEADFELEALRALDTGVTFLAPVPEQVAAAAFSTPLQVRGATGDALLETFFDGFKQSAIDRITADVTLGAAQGLPNADIIRSIRGTVAANRTDGTMERIRRDADAIVRTSVQHVSQTARQATWDANRDIIDRVRWVSTLDSRTTDQCASLDGREFPIDSGPRPPIHVRCRSTTVAVLRPPFDVLERGATRAARNPEDRREIDQVPARLDYYSWLLRQPAAFQDEAIGPTRAKLLRDGGLSSRGFADLQLGRRFEPLTLEEMREKNPVVFERAGL